ncbi:MAG: nuclear transport factor 2 family protein [Acidobacteriota bacterium]|nr:nuclear transport factor 2 family protein [Acidobacteriota bacterium]
MKRLVPALLALALSAAAPALTADEATIAAIQEAVDTAYVQGIHIDQDPEKIRAGFHESFIMFIRTDDGIRQVTRDGWIERIEASKAKQAEESSSDEPTEKPKTTAKITVLDHTPTAAVTKVDLYRDGEQIFTDYISLYHFEDGWKLVGKTFYRH